MKRIIYILFGLTAFLFVSCDLIPHKVTDYFIVSITPSNVEFERVEYESDSIAIATERENLLFYRKKAREMLLDFLKTNPDLSVFENEAKKDAYENLSMQERSLIIIKHKSTMKAEDIVDIIKEYGFGEKLKEYTEKNKLEVKVIEL